MKLILIKFLIFLMSIFKIPFLILRDVLKFFIIYIPGGLGNRLRYIYYKNIFKKCGKNVVIDTGVLIDGAEHISVGDNVHIDKYCILATSKKIIGNIKLKQNHNFNGEQGEIIIGSNIHLAHFSMLIGYGGIEIGDNVAFSAAVKVFSHTNLTNDFNNPSKIISIMPHKQGPVLSSAVVIKKNVWLGLNTIVMPGITIGCNSFSTSNSFLMKDFEENSYISGQPAKKIRNRF